MEVIFCGVGEAFDEDLANTSILVTAGDGDEGQRQVLLDCGFSAAHSFWRYAPDPLELDAVWISHHHGDHFFGLPLILLRSWEEGREKPLHLVGHHGIEDLVTSSMDLAYPGFRQKLRFPLQYVDVAPGTSEAVAGFTWSFARNDHSTPCLSVRLDHVEGSVFYSGDGKPTSETLVLAMGCDLIIHEAFRVQGETAGHGSVEGCIRFALNAGARGLALVHVNREERSRHAKAVRDRLAHLEIRALLPEPGETYEL
ncbi:MAG: MBL fold metallo-hydrolase [Desulfovibrionales bacterium]